MYMASGSHGKYVIFYILIVHFPCFAYSFGSLFHRLARNPTRVLWAARKSLSSFPEKQRPNERTAFLLLFRGCLPGQRKKARRGHARPLFKWCRPSFLSSCANVASLLLFHNKLTKEIPTLFGSFRENFVATAIFFCLIGFRSFKLRNSFICFLVEMAVSKFGQFF